MTKIKTLKQRLKPEIKAKLESNDRKYSDVVRSLFIKLDKTPILVEIFDPPIIQVTGFLALEVSISIKFTSSNNIFPANDSI